MSVHIDPAQFEFAAGAVRREMVGHVRDCAACRAAVAAYDPAILFSLLAETPMPARILEQVSRGASRHAGSDRTSFGALEAAASWSRRGAAVAVFALALMSGYVTLRGRPAPPDVAVDAPSAPPAAIPIARRADVDVHPGRAVSQVVDFTVGDTQVVMVYNGDLQL